MINRHFLLSFGFCLIAGATAALAQAPTDECPRQGNGRETRRIDAHRQDRRRFGCRGQARRQFFGENGRETLSCRHQGWRLYGRRRQAAAGWNVARDTDHDLSGSSARRRRRPPRLGCLARHDDDQWDGIRHRPIGRWPDPDHFL